MFDNYIAKFKNGYVLSIDTDNDFISGCPTCNYGNEYLSYARIELSDYTLYVTALNGYMVTCSDNPVAFTKDDVIKLFDIENIENISQEDFITIFISWCLKLNDSVSVAFRVDTKGLSNYVLWEDRKNFYHFN